MLEAKRHMLKSFLEKLTIGFQSHSLREDFFEWLIGHCTRAPCCAYRRKAKELDLVSLQEGQMDAYRVLVVVLCLTVLGVSQEVGAGTLPVEADQVVNISGSLVLAYS